ncbi:YebC/PmpR family DNA-binding transcriptional regulator [Patescibacteria group bacterium]|nr:MAG: YebC/PmpR family DNA-binding transcriptional regulator [Patescibacteria group bacterium]
MSGHSKWSTIKRQKGAADAKRSVNFTKLATLITVAARESGGDAEANFKLRLAVAKAREANMPKDNIDRAIKRGTGEVAGAAFEKIIYEAYAPGGVALMIECNTDNKNRALANMKAVLNKYNAKLAEAGSVAYLFRERGSMLVSGQSIEKIEDSIIESGADDYELSDDSAIAFTQPKDTMSVAKTLESRGFTVADVELRFEPISTVAISEAKTAQTLSTLIDKLEDLDDVTSVATNFESALD